MKIYKIIKQPPNHHVILKGEICYHKDEGTELGGRIYIETLTLNGEYYPHGGNGWVPLDCLLDVSEYPIYQGWLRDRLVAHNKLMDDMRRCREEEQGDDEYIYILLEYEDSKIYTLTTALNQEKSAQEWVAKRPGNREYKRAVVKSKI